MANTFAVQLVSPEEMLWEGEAEMVVCRSTEGDIAFAAGHEPFLGALADHPVRILLAGNGEQAAAVHGGFVQMSGTSLVVLSDLAELKENIDKGRAEHAKRVAEESLSKNPDDEAAQADLARAETRLAVAG
jgi:F-type H+-transporting ATPase subunit epsilon